MKEEMIEPADKVIDIKGTSWKSIISTGREKRQGLTANAEPKKEQQSGDFFLSFDGAPVIAVPVVTKVSEVPVKEEKKRKPVVEKVKNQSIKIDPIVEAPKKVIDKSVEEAPVKEVVVKKPKRENKKEESEEDDKIEGSDGSSVSSDEGEEGSQENAQDEGGKRKGYVPFEELPNKIKKRIAKRKAKREELKMQRKIKLDLGKSEETVLEKYKVAYGDTMGEEKLKEYVYYQKLIHDAKNKQRVQKKSK